MTWNWFGVRTVTFWQPILSPTEKWWRDEHVLAHVVGGMAWALILRLPIWSAWHDALGLRLLAVAVIQGTFWELVQRENWRPELMHLPPNAYHGYPWLSAIWDVLFTVLGAALLEGGLWLVGRLW